MIYKNGRYYMVKFMWKGKLVRKSTRATDIKTARASLPTRSDPPVLA